MAAHRYWRIQDTRSAPPNSGMAELQFRTTVGGSPLYGTAIGSTAYSTNYALQNAFDGNAGTGWLTTASAPWIGQDYGTPVDIVQYAIRAPDGSSGATSAHLSTLTTQFVLAHSDDGTAWITRDTQNVAAWTTKELRVYAVTPELAAGTYPATGLNAPAALGTPTAVQSAPAYRASGLQTTVFGQPAFRLRAAGFSSGAMGRPQAVMNAAGFLVGGPARFGQATAIRFFPPTLDRLSKAEGFGGGGLGLPSASWLQRASATGFLAGGVGLARLGSAFSASGGQSTAFGAPRATAGYLASGTPTGALGAPRCAIVLRAQSAGAGARVGAARTRLGSRHDAAGLAGGAVGTPVSVERHRTPALPPSARFGKPLLVRSGAC